MSEITYNTKNRSIKKFDPFLSERNAIGFLIKDGVRHNIISNKFNLKIKVTFAKGSYQFLVELNINST